MKRYKKKIITALVIISALMVAWFYGGNYPDKSSLSAEAVSRPWESYMDEGASLQGVSSRGTSVQGDSLQDASSHGTSVQGASLQDASSHGASSQDASLQSTSAQDVSLQGTSLQGDSLKSIENAISPLYADDVSSTMEIDPKTGKDRYLTDPVPEGMPTPVEPQDATVGDDSFIVMLAVRCDTILDNMKYLDKEKHELVPLDGMIFPLAEVTAYEGESVFNILHREMKQARIHMTFRNTPIYNSAYIEAINNLYEFDAGELSGWMYAVNGWYPNYGCSRYTLKPGDVVEWNYTCDLGRDLGQYWVTGFQEE